MDIRGVYMFSSLVKQNKKAKICFVIHLAAEKKLLFYIYFVIVKQKFINGPLITTAVHVPARHGEKEKVGACTRKREQEPLTRRTYF
jgi:hypothetical protein